MGRECGARVQLAAATMPVGRTLAEFFLRRHKKFRDKNDGQNGDTKQAYCHGQEEHMSKKIARKVSWKEGLRTLD